MREFLSKRSVFDTFNKIDLFYKINKIQESICIFTEIFTNDRKDIHEIHIALRLSTEKNILLNFIIFICKWFINQQFNE